MKYRFKSEDGTPIDQTIPDTLCRVATALAEPEQDSGFWKEKHCDNVVVSVSLVEHFIFLSSSMNR